MVTERIRGRPSANVHLISNPQRAFSDAFNLARAKIRNDSPPLEDRGRTETERPRDIRGSLKVINNVLLEHVDPFTTVKGTLQPKCKDKSLTSVAMDRLATIAERLSHSMEASETSASDLARACGVSPAAVHKWLTGGKLNADNLAAAARSLGVREEWLRTGRLPQDRENGAQEEGVERVVEILQNLRGPLAELAAAIDQLSSKATRTPKRRDRA